MEQIIAICLEHNISMLADFALDRDGDGKPLKCTSAILGSKFDTPRNMLMAYEMVKPDAPCVETDAE